MQTARAVALAAACALSTPALAVEGPTVAGPIGGNDIRSAVLPPPGLYGGVVLLHASTIDFLDRHGNTIPLFRDAQLHKQVAGPFLYYVPKLKLLGGSIGFGGMVPLGNQCGHLFVGQPSECERGIGDPYIELDWSRNFGTVRPSKYPGAYPILQVLSVLVGFGMVLPVGQYEDDDLLEQVLSPGTNIWDFAPTLGVTYTTPPILAEGTEFSAKAYLNNYLENPSTRYYTGRLINIDFAVTERIGRFQVGVAGFYAWQIEDDDCSAFPFCRMDAAPRLCNSAPSSITTCPNPAPRSG